MYMLQCIGVFGELERVMPSEEKKKDADIPLKKTGVVGPFRSRRNTEH